MLKKINIVAVSLALSIAPFIASADVLTRQLEIGMRGTDVSSLQTYLATDDTLYPQGLVTGYFGYLTKSAVSNFQSRNGIDAVGRVGPATLPVLNAKMSGGMTSTYGAPIISSFSINTSRTSATINYNTNENARGVIYYSTSPLTTYENENSVTVSGNTALTDSNYRSSQSIVLSGLQPYTTYYYMAYTTDQNGLVSVSWPSTFMTTN